MSALPNSSFDRLEPEFVVEPDVSSLIDRVAERIALAADNSVAARGRFTLVLSGGSTPKSLYELLANEPWRTRIDWQRTHVFWEDERWVPSSDPANNYRMTRDALISKVPLPAQNVHRIPTDSGTPETAAGQYGGEIKSFFRDADPIFDFILLGVGTNGHTASLFPYRPTLHETSRLAIADYVDEVGMYRVTLTLGILNAGREVAFLASGREKAKVVNDVVNGPYDPERLPSQLIRPSSGRLTWFLDAAAAADLPQAGSSQDL